MSDLKQRLRAIAMWFFRAFGTEIVDQRTGRNLGRAFLLPWRGKIHVLGLATPVRSIPLPQKRVNYWHQAIGFATHPPLDFPRRLPAAAKLGIESSSKAQASRPLIVMLDHRAPAIIEALIGVWTGHVCLADEFLFIYGGSEIDFPKISHPHKLFIGDPRLRTCDHQREHQSYRAILEAVSNWLDGKNFTHVLFVEGDHLPLVPNLPSLCVDLMAAEDCDVLGHWASRIDGTTHPHWLHASHRGWDEGETLSLLGTGHFWRREAWDAAAAARGYNDLYLELDLPTAAHRAGYRVVSFPEKFTRWVKTTPLGPDDMVRAGADGSWTIHPIKDFTSESTRRVLAKILTQASQQVS